MWAVGRKVSHRGLAFGERKLKIQRPKNKKTNIMGAPGLCHSRAIFKKNGLARGNNAPPGLPLIPAGQGEDLGGRPIARRPKNGKKKTSGQGTKGARGPFPRADLINLGQFFLKSSCGCFSLR